MAYPLQRLVQKHTKHFFFDLPTGCAKERYVVSSPSQAAAGPLEPWINKHVCFPIFKLG